MDGWKSYKAPVPDPSTGLDLSKLPVPDADISKLSLTMPSSSTHTAVPYSPLASHGEYCHGNSCAKSDTRAWRHWLRCRDSQGQFRYYWGPGSDNQADYYTKHHCAAHHIKKRP